MSAPLTISQFVSQLQTHVESRPDWQHLALTGELSNVKKHSAGHWYFLIKDAQSSITAVLFRQDAQALKYPLEDGMAVILTGRVGVFNRNGQTQIYAKTVTEIGQGADARLLQMLTEKLAHEGLFKRPPRVLPKVPRLIGVVTSGTGAVRHDIETVAQRRFPGMAITLEPVIVQGPGAPDAIAQAIVAIQKRPIDVLIIGRGGGSKEDLKAFNDERVVRAAFAAKIPTISAVGHEVDITLLDRVCDYRAATPSAAAELAVPEKAVLLADLAQRQVRWQQAIAQTITTARQQWQRRQDHPLIQHPDQLFTAWHHQIETFHTRLAQWPLTALPAWKLKHDKLEDRFSRVQERWLSEQNHKLETFNARLSALDPQGILTRGYAFVTDDHNNVCTAANAPRHITIHWADGTRQAQLLPLQENEVMLP